MGKFGPDFLPANSILYRIEYAVFSLIILYALYSRYTTQGLDVLLTVVFALLPDIVFIPMGTAMKKGSWPSWGSTLYNFSHSLVVLIILAAVMYATGQFFWPLLGWALHITLDRSIGYCLRAKK